MTTIRELADRLNVSVATVSRSLNDKPGVSQETRERVLQLAKELDYSPNQAARNLTTSKTRNVIFSVIRRQFPLGVDPFYPQIMQGMEEVLTGEDYNVTLVTINEDQLSNGPKSLAPLREKRADAVILAGPDIPPNFILETSTMGFQTLLVDNALRETQLPAVLADNQGGSFAITNHLIEVHGHEQIVLLRGPSKWISSEERTAGYLEAIEAAGLKPQIVQANDTTLETGQITAKQTLEAHPQTTAIVAVNDAMAIGAIRAAHGMDYKIPDDLAIVGFDNISWAAFADPPLTTVRIPKIEMGRIAARMLLEQLNGSISVNFRTTVATQLIIRASCNCTTQQDNDGSHTRPNAPDVSGST